ncbi:hypothetical protein EMCRGX_G031870 [Ephydatia muelleri]
MTKSWPQRWGFVAEGYNTMNHKIKEAKQKGTVSNGSVRLPPLTPPKQEAAHPFPCVTSREVGWLSSRPDRKLEVFGRWGRPRYSIYKQLKWPSDAVP